METNNSFNSLCSALDVDREYLEILLPYLDTLIKIGVDLNHIQLQEVIEGHVIHLETACRAVIGYAGWLAHCGDRFDSRIHATSCLIKALVEQWEPHINWKSYAEIAAQARYLSPYETAYRLIHELRSRDESRTWSPNVLDCLSDQEIEALIPSLEQDLNHGSKMRGDGDLRAAFGTGAHRDS
jgi:hypothetical protein